MKFLEKVNLKSGSTVDGEKIIHNGNKTDYLASDQDAGFISQDDKIKLNTIESNAEVNLVDSVNGKQGDVQLTYSDVNAEPAFGKSSAFNKNFGTTSGTVAEGNHTHTFGSLTSKPTTLSGYGITDAYTKSQVDQEIANIVESAPETLNTLNELAAALGDDPNFATTVSNDLGNKVNKTTTISAGSGLLGGGDLSSNRTISIDFDGTGAATAVARSDHDHDSTYSKLGHTHTESDITDLDKYTQTEVDNLLAQKSDNHSHPYDNYNSWNLQANGGSTTAIGSGEAVNFSAGENVSIARSGNTIDISSSYVNTHRPVEEIEDIVSNLLSSGSHISLDYDDANAQLTINSTDTNHYLDSVSGAGNGTITFAMSGRNDHSLDLSHRHDNATTSLDGFMSSEDKSKLNNIQSGAEVNTVYSVNDKTGAVDLTYADVGAAPSSHDHDTRYVNLSGDTMSGKLGIDGSGTLLELLGNNQDVMLRLGHTPGGYGFDLKYTGTESGANNALELWTDGSGTSDGQKRIFRVAQNGVVNIDRDANINGNKIWHQGDFHPNNFADANHTHKITDLTDTSISGISTNHVLQWNGSDWVNRTLSSAGIASASSVSNHTSNTNNPHNVTANQVGALTNIAGVSNGGGGVDIVAGSNINVSASHSNKTVTIGISSDDPPDAGTVGGYEAEEFVLKAGDQMTGHLVLNSDPEEPSHAANKGYVDAVKQGLDIKNSVRVATINSITLVPSTKYSSRTIDGVPLNSGDRVLVRKQTNASENGIYVVQSDYDLVRADDANNNTKISSGLFTFVEEGNINENSGWVLTTDGTIQVGTTELHFVRFSGAGQIIAGDGLSKSGNELSINFAGTGSSKQAAKSDHHHDEDYLNKNGDSMSGELGMGDHRITNVNSIILNNKETTTVAADNGALMYDQSAGPIIYHGSATNSPSGSEGWYTIWTGANVSAGDNISIIGGSGSDSTPTLSVIQGHNSGLDADTLDTLHVDSFMRADTNTKTTGRIFIEDGSDWGGTGSISLAIGDADTGLDWVSDGNLDIKSNGTTVASVSPGHFGIDGHLNLNNQEIRAVTKILGQYGTIAESTDEWLRLNSDESHTKGIYTGSSKIRTDNQLEIGSDGEHFKADASGNVTAATSVETPEVKADHVTAYASVETPIAKTQQMEVQSSTTSEKFTIEFDEEEGALNFVYSS